MTSSGKEYIHTPEQEAKRARRLAKKERQLKAERVKPLAHNLRTARACGVVLMKRAVAGDLLTGIEETFGRERILYMQAAGTILGTPDDNLTRDYSVDDEVSDYELEAYSAIGTRISEHWREHKGKSLLIFDGLKFGVPDRYPPTPIAGRIESFLSESSKNNPMILMLGHGNVSDLKTSTTYKPDNQPKLAALLHVVYALGSDRMLRSVLDPALLPPPANER